MKIMTVKSMFTVKIKDIAEHRWTSSVLQVKLVRLISMFGVIFLLKVVEYFRKEWLVVQIFMSKNSETLV